MDDIRLFKNRMCELSREAYDGGYYTASHFLTLAEQAELVFLRREGAIGAYTLKGGFAGAERCLALFGSEELFGYAGEAPCVFLMIAPVQMKFADTLSHRDLLGGLMSLGIRRECLGDIVISGNIGYLYAEETVAPYIAETLKKVRHTDVKVETIDTPPTASMTLPDITELVVASERLDAAIAAVYKLSRQEAETHLQKGLVMIDGRLVQKSAYSLHQGEIVSVRGKGRFLFEGVTGDTRKGKLRIAVRIFR